MAKAKSNYFRDLLSEIKDDTSSIAADGKSSAEYTGYVDTGSYALNALFSGSVRGGIPNNKVVAFAGESAVGKTFFVLGIIKHFLDSNPSAGVVYYDTEAAVTREMMESRGIDTSRIIVAEPVSIQTFRTHAIKMLDAYSKTSEKDRPPLMMALDSLGALSTNKEIEDTTEGKDTRDMTRAQLIRGAFRVLRLKLAKAKVPMLVTNHVYAGVGQYVPTQIMSGGGGLRYASDDIVMLSKSKDRVGTDVVGGLIKARTYKSRNSRENQEVIVKLSYVHGLDKYYGLRDIAEKTGLLKKGGTKYELSDGRKVYGKEIDDSPAEIFEPIMDQLDAAAAKLFKYGHGFGDDEPRLVDGVLAKGDGEVVD